MHWIVINNLAGTRVIITVVDYNFTGILKTCILACAVCSWLAMVIRRVQQGGHGGAYVVIKSLMIRTSSLNGMLLLFNDISAL